MGEDFGFDADAAVWTGLSDADVEDLFAEMIRISTLAMGSALALLAAARRRRMFATDGMRSTADWVAAKTLVDPQTAARMVRVAIACERLDLLAEAVLGGDVSLDQAAVIARFAEPSTVGEMLAAAACTDTVAGLRRTCRFIAALAFRGPIDEVADDEVADDAKPQQQVAAGAGVLSDADPDRTLAQPDGANAPSTVSVSAMCDGRWLLVADLAADDGHMVANALRQLGETEPATISDGAGGEVRIRWGQRMAQALVGLFAGERSAPRPELVVHVHHLGDGIESLAEFGSGEPMTMPALERLGCDATFRPILYGSESTVGIGRTSKQIPEPLARYIRARDGHRCRFPGCDRAVWLQIHHIQHWSKGGPTDAGNLILICARHHRLVHEEGWELAGTAEQIEVRRPDRTELDFTGSARGDGQGPAELPLRRERPTSAAGEDLPPGDPP